MLEQLIGIDQDITLWINGLHTAWMEPFWMFLSNIPVWFPAYGAIMGVVFWRLGWKKGLVVVLSCVLTVVLCDQISSHVKETVGRLRPLYSTWMLQHGLHWPLGRYDFYGFFSGHASNSFGFAACSYLGFQRNDREHRYKAYGICALIWAGLMSLSRLMLAAHYFGDILVGTVFGLAVGSLCALLGRSLIVRLKL